LNSSGPRRLLTLSGVVIEGGIVPAALGVARRGTARTTQTARSAKGVMSRSMVRLLCTRDAGSQTRHGEGYRTLGLPARSSGALVTMGATGVEQSLSAGRADGAQLQS